MNVYSCKCGMAMWQGEGVPATETVSCCCGPLFQLSHTGVLERGAVFAPAVAPLVADPRSTVTFFGYDEAKPCSDQTVFVRGRPVALREFDRPAKNLRRSAPTVTAENACSQPATDGPIAEGTVSVAVRSEQRPIEEFGAVDLDAVARHLARAFGRLRGRARPASKHSPEMHARPAFANRAPQPPVIPERCTAAAPVHRAIAAMGATVRRGDAWGRP